MSLESMIQKAETAHPLEKGDYQQDGLWYCGICRTPKQCRLSIGGRTRIVFCQCACAERRYREKLAAQKREEERLRIDSLRLTGIADKGLRHCCFEEAEDTPLLRKCRSYAQKWERAARENIGLLLWGDTGGGKTFAAACIANAIIDLGVPALITSFPRILAADWEDRGEFIRNAGRFPLLVLDDLGAEQGNDYALRTVYTVVDERYKSGKPLIVTTNLSLDALRNPGNVDYKRIYDRVLELCTPVMAEKQDFRSLRAAKKLRMAHELLEVDGA